MALNMQTLKTRSLTAVIFVVVMLVGLLWNFWSFVVLFTIIHWGCWIEYLNLVEKIYNTVIDKFIKNYFAFCGTTLMWVLGQNRIGSDLGFYLFGYPVSVKYLIWVVLFLGLLIFIFQNQQISSKLKSRSFLGFVYISLSFTLLLNLRANYDFGIMTAEILNTKFPTLYQSFLTIVFPISIIFSIWINDTMAYVVGSLIGKTPLSKISPKKTWEGTIGGVILCILIIGFLFNTFFSSIETDTLNINIAKFRDWLIIAALCAIFGTLGDLFESKLKRMANVKDSGSFMPGHGGFLDRFDSLLFAVPAVWVYVKLFL